MTEAQRVQKRAWHVVLCENDVPDLLLLDLKMPGMSCPIYSYWI